ncbi:MAG: Ig-like domain-containing protein [Planctomycetia bacterium]
MTIKFTDQVTGRPQPVPFLTIAPPSPPSPPFGAGTLTIDDFILSRDGVVVPWTAAVKLTTPTAGTEAFATYQLSGLETLTNAPGAYTLTFADLGIAQSRTVSWVKNFDTPVELRATLTPNPGVTNGLTRTPLDSVTVRFTDAAGAANGQFDPTDTVVPVQGVTVGGRPVATEFVLYRNGTLENDFNTDPRVTIQGSGNTYTITGLAAVTGTVGAYELRIKSAGNSIRGLFDPDVNPDGATLKADESLNWQYFSTTISAVTERSAPENSLVYRAGEIIEYEVAFVDPAGNPQSVNVNVAPGTSPPSLQFRMGGLGTIGNATYHSGHGTSRLRFRYTVRPGDLDMDGVVFEPAIVGSSSITDTSGAAIFDTFAPPDTTIRVDGVAPAVQSVTQPTPGVYGVGATLDFTVNFDDTVTVTGSPSLPITIGGIARQAVYNADASRGSRAVFRYTVVAGDSASGAAGSVQIGSSITLNGGTIRDTNLNDAVLTVPATTISSVVVNRLVATVTAGANKTYRLGETIQLTATFTEIVNVTGTPTVTATIGTTTGSRTATFTYVSGSGTTALVFRGTVAANDLDTDGIEITGIINLPGTPPAAITSNAGTPVGLAFTPPATSAILVDGVAPRALATINGPVPGTYVSGDRLRFIVALDDVVQLSGPPPALTFTMLGSLGPRVGQATYTGGDQTSLLTFEYEVQAGDFADRVSIGANPITLNGGAVRDASGNAVDFSTISSATFSGVFVNLAGVMQVTLASPGDKYYRAGENLLFDVEFSAPVTVTGAPVLSLVMGSATRNATYVSGSGTATLRFRYTVVAGDNDQDGVQFDVPTVLLPATATITSLGGNAQLAFVPPDISGVRVDAVAPTLASPSPVVVPTSRIYKLGDTLQFVVTFSESLRVTPQPGTGNVPRIALVIGSQTRHAQYVAGNETPVLVFDYVVQAGDLDSDGIVMSTAITLNGATITDLAGNPGGLVYATPPTNGVLVDGVAPTLTRFSTTKANGTYTIGEPIVITATMSKDVRAGSMLEVVLDTGALVLLTAPAVGRTLSGTYVVTPGENSPDLDVVAYRDVDVRDVAGNTLGLPQAALGDPGFPVGGNTIAAVKSIVVDTIAPTVTVTSDRPALKIGETATITFTLSEGSVNFQLDDVVASGGILSNFAGSGTSYTARFTPTANSTAAGAVTVLARTFTDAAGNDNLAGDLAPTITIDTVAPTLAITSDKPVLKAGDVARITFTLSEIATDFALDDITFTGGGLSGFTGSGTSYTAIFTPTPTAGGSGTINVAAGRFTDSVGNDNVAGALSPAIVIDTVAPTVTIASSTPTLRSGQTATITFTLSEPATNFAADDVTTTGGLLSGFTGSGTSYTATFTPTANSTASGTISVAAGRFTDSAGNDNVAGALSPAIVIDTVAPTVTIASSTPTLRSGQTATITFTLSEPATNFAASDVTTTGGLLSGFTGSGTSYTATFTPTANSTASGTISVAAGRFTDSAGNDNVATSLAPAITIDTVAPTITGFTAPTGIYPVGSQVEITAVLSEPVRGGGRVIVGLNTGASVTLTAVANATKATGNYLVQIGQQTDKLRVTSVAADVVDPIRDLAGNAIVAGTLPPDSDNLGTGIDVVIDGALRAHTSAPFSTSPLNVSNVGSAVTRIPIRFTAPVTGVTLAAFELYLDGRAVSLRDAQVSGTGADYAVNLPDLRANPSGIYSLVVRSDAGIRAIGTSVTMTEPSRIFWGKDRSLTATLLESIGSVRLARDASGTLYADNMPISIGGNPVDFEDMQATGWTAVAAERIDGINTLVWQHSSGNLHLWRLSGTWAHVRSEGWYARGSAEHAAVEIAVGMDLGGDGVIGETLTTLESTGSVRLARDAAGKLYAADTPISLGGNPVNFEAMAALGWTAVAAEQIDGINTLIWRHSSGNLHLWRLSATWAHVSSEGWYAPGSPEHQNLSLNFGA